MDRDAVSRLLAAAELGDHAAQRELGLAYFRGLGVRRDPARAFKWLSLAAESGDPTAVVHLETLLPGLTGEDIADGRRMIARAKGQPEPDFGFPEFEEGETPATHAPHQSTSRSSETLPWQASESAMNELEEAAVVCASERVSAPVRRALRGPTTATQSVQPVLVEPLSPPSASRVLVLGLWVAVSLVAVAMVFAVVALANRTPPRSTIAVANGPSKAPLVGIEDHLADGSTPLARTNLPQAIELTELSKTLPGSLRRITPALALRWEKMDELRALAGSGDADAQFDLAQWHLLQAQTTNDFAEAVRLLDKAATAGIAQAQNNLGFCYVTATGVGIDYIEGYKWFAIAVSGGLRGATANRNRCAELLTGEQLALASAKVAKFLEARRPRVPPRLLNQAFSKRLPESRPEISAAP